MELNVIKNRYIYFGISWALFLISIIFLIFGKMNLWIDMTWWIQIEYKYENNLNIEDVRTKVDELSENTILDWKKVINETDVYKVTWENVINVVVWFNSVSDEKALETTKNDFKNSTLELLKEINPSIIETSYLNIWKTFWDHIRNQAFITLWIAIIAITVYVTWAFSWVASWINFFSFSSITIFTLFHDVVIASWLYIITSLIFPEFKIDTFFVTALLTILWYSINDTIVVFDRIRSNLKQIWKHKKELSSIIEFSIKETLTRSVYTSLTVLFVLITIFFFGPDSISWFTLVMIFWTIVWTYSSIFIASPLLYELNKSKKIDVFKEKDTSQDHKIVV